MSRKMVQSRWIGLALVASLAIAAPAGAAGFSGRGAAPASPSVWSQVLAWVVGGLQSAGAPVTPLVSVFGKVGMHIDPNGYTEPTSDPAIGGGSSSKSVNISVTVDPGQ